jgi:hypothetical protein
VEKVEGIKEELKMQKNCLHFLNCLNLAPSEGSVAQVEQYSPLFSAL